MRLLVDTRLRLNRLRLVFVRDPPRLNLNLLLTIFCGPVKYLPYVEYALRRVLKPAANVDPIEALLDQL